jgi:RNA polymerase sigma factor (sigma-70 family)
MCPDDAVDDQKLALRAASGDRQALEALYLRHQAGLRLAILRHRVDAALADDVVQDAFVDLARGMQTYDPQRPFLPWMRRVCHNRLIKHLRMRRPGADPAMLETLVGPEDSTPGPFSGQEDIAALRRCVEALPSEQRELLDRRYARGESMSSMAANLHVEVNALMVRFHRLRRRLRDCLKAKGIEA